MKKLNVLFIFITLFFLGCSQSVPKAKEIFQTDNAVLIKKDYQQISKLLLEFKEKLNARNPGNYDKNFTKLLSSEIKNEENKLYLKHQGEYVKNHNAYLALALNPIIDLKNRNDFLILGMYKFIWHAYKKESSHKVSTLSYDKKLLKELYYAFNVLNWKIKTEVDTKRRYLFLTWQNNWQVELKKRIVQGKTPSWEMIKSLKHIKNNKESIFSPSNHSFEVLMRQMLYHIEHSLKLLGDEPLDIGIEAMKNFVFFL